jgi:excisionase family DNA binding protein
MEVDQGLVVSGQDGQLVRIAPAVGELIVELLGHVASGNMVTIAPYGAMLTTQQAADILNVSRPHLTKLLKAGEIPHEMVGRHRRVPLADVMAYRAAKRAARSDALDELARLGQDFDAG